MKKIIALSIVILLVISNVEAQTPQFFNANNSGSNNNWPLNAASQINNRCQWNYGPNLFSSLGGGLGVPAYAGLITDVYFRLGSSVNPTSVYDINMAIGQNVGTQISFINGTYITGLTPILVNSSYSLTGATTFSWYRVTLPTPFLYNPSASLVFEIYQAGTGGGNLLSQNTSIPGNRIYGGQAAAGGVLGNGLVDFGFDLIPNVLCTGQPNAGTTTGPANPCPGVLSTYYLTGATLASGLTYQWINSSVSCNGPWNVMLNDTNSSMSTIPPIGQTTYYRCIVTCTSSALSDTSTCLAVTPQVWSPYSPCYCYTSVPTATNDENIGQVTVGTFQNPAVAPPQINNPNATAQFSNFENLTMPCYIQGQTYPISVLQTSTFGGNSTSWTKAWIDYNHNTSWADPGEEVFSMQSNFGNTFNPAGTFTIPTNALPGLTRMRFVLREFGSAANTDPCSAYPDGETEDYVICILAAGPHDPSVTNIQVLPSSGCMDSNSTVILTLGNFGGQNLDPQVDSFQVTLNVNGPSGLTTYTQNVSSGIILSPFNANSSFVVFTGVNMYEGGCYDVNTDTITMFTSTNTNLVNDSLFAAVTVCNSRPNSGPDYNLCLGDTIPTGQGLSIINCPTGYVQDSVIIPFTFSFSGNTPPNPINCAASQAGVFASASMPNLPSGANILNGEISVTNLAIAPLTFTTNPTFARFSLHQGPLPTTNANVFHNGAQGSTSTSSFGCFDYLSYPPAADLNSMYNTDGTPVVPTVNMGHWAPNRCTTPTILTNCFSGTSVVYLKLVYEYIPMGVSWYEQPSGGVRISDSSILNPFLTPNSIVNSSSGIGTYTFYGACAVDTNCRVESNLIISSLSYASIMDTAVNCYGDSTGSIQGNATGGVPPYTYTLTGPITPAPNTTGYFANLPAGIYTLNAADISGCSTGDSIINITAPPPLVIDSIVSVSPSCTPGGDGTMTVYTSGGTVGSGYQYSNGGAFQTSNVFINQAANTYTITVSDGNSCVVSSTHILIAPSGPTITNLNSTNVLCNGDTSGTISVSAAAGANPNIWFTRTPPGVLSTTGNFTGVGAGSYTIRAVDSNNCFVDSAVTITEPSALFFASSTVTNVSCNGGSNGSLTVSAGGGVPGYSYQLNPPSTPNTTGVFTSLTASLYTVRITDTNGCTHDTTIAITEPPVLVISSSSTTQVLCYGDTTGQIVMTANGGTQPMQGYIISPTATQPALGTFTGLAAGTYTITGTDANNCTAITTISITQPTSALSISSITSTTPSCVPGCDANMTVVANGGTPGYSYSHGSSLAQISPIFTSQCAGTYLVTVTDTNGCIDTMSHTISTPGSPTWSNITIDSVDCNGGSDGGFTVNVNLGSSAIDTIEITAPGSAIQVLSTNSPTGSATNLTAGAYTVRAVDANGCAIVTNIIVSEPAQLAFGSVIVDSVDCNGGNDGSITTSVTGGTLNYTYCINTSPVQCNGTGLFTNLVQGNYQITVTDANNCSIITNVTVNQPPVLNYLNVSSTNVSCNGAADGGINATGSGGTNPLSISLVPNAGIPNPASFTGLNGGPQTVRITDGKGCTLDSLVTILEPTILSIDTVSVTHVLCYGDSTGQIVLTRNGGTPAVAYSISPTLGNQNPVGDSTINNLPAGVYTVTGIDANLCSATTSVTITEPATAVSITSVTGTTPSCSPGNDGTITIIANGGTAPLRYGRLPIPPNVYQSSNVLTGLSSGGYAVRVVDTNGCITDTNFTITNSSAPTIDSFTTVATLCNGDSTGSMIVYATGNPQSTVTYQIIAPYLSPIQVNGSFGGLAAGFYTVEVNDINNCPVQTTIQITEPTAVGFSGVVANNVSCFGGNDGGINLTAIGGTSPYTATPLPNTGPSPNFSFINLSAGLTSVQLTDNNGCTADSMVAITQPTQVSIDTAWSTDVLCNGDSTGGIIVQSSGGTPTIYHVIGSDTINSNPAIFVNYGSGTYTIIAVDANGCVTTSSISVNQPAPLTHVYASTNATCFGTCDGTITTTGTGGIGPYGYVLLPANTNNLTGQFTGLCAGTNYQGIITDNNGCIDSTVFITITEPTQVLFTSVFKQDIDCFGQSTGSITASANGGTLPDSIRIPGFPPQPSPATFNNLPAGTYVLTASDANGCSTTTSVTIIENPQIFFSSITNIEEICYGDGKAEISFQAAGGVGGFTYTFDVNGNPQGPSPQTTYTGLSTGTYIIRATDALGCTYDSSYTLSGPDRINFPVFVITPTTCLDTEDGKLTVEAAGGRGGRYTYSLESGLYINTTGIFRDLSPKQYTLRTTDTAGCFIDTTIDIPLPTNPMVVSITKEDLGCHGRGNEGKAEAVVTGGTTPYTYLWSSTPVQTSSRALGLYQGLHTVDVVDAQGCLERDTIVIEPGPCCQEIFLPNAFSPNGDGRNDEFRILSSAAIQIQQFEIRNRWGIKIWETNNVRSSWDGLYGDEPVNTGTYFYVLRYKCLTDGQEYTKQGDVIVVR